MCLNNTGRLVSEAWQWLGTQYPYVVLDEFVVMPNHLHGILMITDDARRGGSRTAPTGAASPDGKRKPLGRLFGAFKTVSTKRVNCAHGLSGRPLWQRNYFEHVVRNDESLSKIRQYIGTIRRNGHSIGRTPWQCHRRRRVYDRLGRSQCRSGTACLSIRWRLAGRAVRLFLR